MTLDPTYPTDQLESGHDGVQALSLTASLSALTVAKANYDSAVTAWVGAGSLPSGAEYDAMVAAEAAWQTAIGNVDAARVTKANAIAQQVQASLEYQRQNAPADPIAQMVAVARILAVELLPNGTPAELGL